MLASLLRRRLRLKALDDFLFLQSEALSTTLSFSLNGESRQEVERNRRLQEMLAANSSAMLKPQKQVNPLLFERLRERQPSLEEVLTDTFK